MQPFKRLQKPLGWLLVFFLLAAIVYPWSPQYFGWQYRNPILINGSSSDLYNYSAGIILDTTAFVGYSLYGLPISVSSTGSELVDYQINVTIENSTLLGHMAADGRDLRFFNRSTADPYNDTYGKLNFYVENISPSRLVAWVKAGVPASGGAGIYMYYGNALAAAESSIVDTYTRPDEPVLPVQAVFHFDEGSGNTIRDSSGGGNNGTLYNGPSWVGGKSLTALGFDGLDDYASVPDSPSLRSSNFSLSLWAKNSSAITGERVLLTKGLKNVSYRISVVRDGRIRFSVQNSSYNFSRVGSLTLEAGENDLEAAAIDPDGEYAYFGTNTAPSKVVKIRLSNFSREAVLTFSAGENQIGSAVIDPAGRYAYFGTATNPGRVVKVDLSNFSRVGSITLPAGENSPYSGVIDPRGEYAYFGTDTIPGKVVRVNLSSFSRVDSITLSSGENYADIAVIDPKGEHAYFVASVNPAIVVKINLSSFSRVGSLPLGSGEAWVWGATIDQKGEYAYIVPGTTPAIIVKVNLSTFSRAGSLTLDTGEGSVNSAVVDPKGEYAYFATGTYPGKLVRVSLSNFSRIGGVDFEAGEDGVYSSLIDLKGEFAYFGTSTSPGKVVKVRLSDFSTEELLSTSTISGSFTHIAATKNSTRMGLYINGALENSSLSAISPVASDELYIGSAGVRWESYGRGGGYLTTAFPGAIDELRIYNKSLNGTEAFALYNRSELFRKTSSPEPVASAGNESADDSGKKMLPDCGDARFADSDGTNLSYWLEAGCNTGSTKFWAMLPFVPANASKKVYLYYGNSTAASAGSVNGTFLGETGGGAPVLGAWSLDEGAGTLAADMSGNGNNGTLYNSPAWSAGRSGSALGFGVFDGHVKIPHSSSLNPPEFSLSLWAKNTSAIAGERTLLSKGAMDIAYRLSVLPDGRIKFTARNSSQSFSRVGAIDFGAGEGRPQSAAIDPKGEYAYFGTLTSPAKVVKVNLSDFSRVAAITLDSGENSLYSAAMDPRGEYAYFGTYTIPGKVVKINLSNFSRAGSLTLESGENNVYSAVIDPRGEYAYFGTDTLPGRVIKVNLSNFSRVGGISFNSGEDYIETAVIDPRGEYAYFGTITDNGIIVKVDISTFSRVGSLTLGATNDYLISSTIDPRGEYAYFGAYDNPSTVARVRLSDFSKAGELTLAVTENGPLSLGMDVAGGFAYLGVGSNPGIIKKINLSNFPAYENLTLAAGESNPISAVFDPAGEFAYFGADITPGKVVKVRLATFTKEELVSASRISGSFTHIAATKGSGSVKLFVNGALENSTSSIISPSVPDNLTMGYSGLRPASSTRGGGFFSTAFPGIIDEVRIYNRSLAEAEVFGLSSNYGYVTPNYPGRELLKGYASPGPSQLSLGVREAPAYFSAGTYLNGNPESFFAENETIEVRVSGSFFNTPYLTIRDPSGAYRLPSMPMASAGADSFSYNYTVSGPAGWWNLSVDDGLFSSEFYLGRAWPGEWQDYGGKTYPFRLQFNVSEPGASDRFFEPADVRLNFTYGAHNKSVRILQWNGSRLLEVPSQLYALNSSGERVNSANVFFLSSLARNSTKQYFAYYSRSDTGAPAYPAALLAQDRTSYFEVESSNFRVLLNGTRGGVIASASSRVGSGRSLAGFSPMELSPSVSSGPYVYRASDLTNPSVSIEEGGLRSVYSASGAVGTIDYLLRYTFFANSPYFILETNVTAKTSESWDYLKNHYLFFGEGIFSAVAHRNSTGIYSQQAPAGDGPDISFTGLAWLGFFNNLTGDSMGDVFIGSAPQPEQTSFYNSLSYDYYEQRQHSGAVSAGSSFYSKVARVLWRVAGGFLPLNATYNVLANPIAYSLGNSETSDSTPPYFSVFNQTPYSPADTDNLTCFSRWSDNLELDYALVRVNSSSYGNGSALSIRANESWVNATIPAGLLEAGTVTCNFTVFDIAGLSNSTEWNFSVLDNSSPVISAQVYSPSSSAGLDPNVSVSVSVNLTEYSGVSSAVLQHRLNGSGWANTSMAGANTSSFGYYFSANFTPDAEGVWEFRVLANDSLGNAITGPASSLSVYYDWTWGLSPQDFGIKNVLLGNNLTPGFLLVNNTGDMPLSFRLSSNWGSDIFFNSSPEGTGYYFSLLPGGSANISVLLASSSKVGDDSLRMTVDALNSSAQPSLSVSNATIISYAGGPFLYINFVRYNSSATQGDSGLLFRATVQNVGNESASGAGLRWSLPSGWALASGNLTGYVGGLAVNDFVQSEITADVGDSAAAGIQKVYLSANSSGNRSWSKSVDVIVSARPSQTTVVQQAPQDTGFVTSGPAIVSNASSGWSGGLTREQRGQLFRTSERFELVRGRDSSFPILLTNPLGGTLENVSLSASGYLSKYIRIEPDRLDSLGAGESFTFKAVIEAPKYFNTGRYDLEFAIRGTVSEALKSGNRTVLRVTSMEEERSVVLFVHDLDRGEAGVLVNSSRLMLSDMSAEGLAVRGVSELVEQAEVKLRAGDYEAVKVIAQEIEVRRGQAVFVKTELSSLDSLVREVERRGVSAPDTLRLLNLAKAGFARGDFAAAKARLEEARLTLALESKGEFNAWFFVRENPRLVFGGLAGLFVLYFLVVLNVRFAVLSGDIKNLRREEGILVGLMKEVQRECFDEKKLSMEEYDEAMLQYENKLSSVVHKLIESEALRANVFRFGGRERSLLVERGRLLEEIKRTQRDYMERGAIETHSYELRMRTFVSRLSEVEDKVASLEADRYLRGRGLLGRLRGLFVRGK